MEENPRQRRGRSLSGLALNTVSHVKLGQFTKSGPGSSGSGSVSQLICLFYYIYLCVGTVINICGILQLKNKT